MVDVIFCCCSELQFIFREVLLFLEFVSLSGKFRSFMLEIQLSPYVVQDWFVVGLVLE
jgi:hypothetical protein